MTSDLSSSELKEIQQDDSLETKQEINMLLLDLQKQSNAKWEECKKIHTRIVRVRARLIEICDPKFIEKQKRLTNPDAGHSLFKYLEFVD